MNIDFGQLLNRAWKITWNNKILWIFGVLAALGSGGGGGGGGGNSNFRTGPVQPSQLPGEWGRFLERLQQNGSTLIAISIAVICVFILIGLVIWLLSLIGRGGLIGGARLADANGRVAFGEAWSEGTRHLVRLVLLQIPLILLGLIVLLVVLVPVGLFVFSLVGSRAAGEFSQGQLGSLFAMLGCIFIVVCPLALVGILLRILIHFAQFAVVLEDQSPMAAYRRAWEVIKANIAPILILGIILIVAGFIIGLVISLPLLFVVVPMGAGFVASMALGQGAPIAAGIIFALVCCVVWVPVMLVLRGVFETWATSTWTLAYQQFIGPRADAPAAPYPVMPANPSV